MDKIQPEIAGKSKISNFAKLTNSVKSLSKSMIETDPSTNVSSPALGSASPKKPVKGFWFKLRKKSKLIIFLLLVAGGGYYYYNSTKTKVTTTTYTLAKATKGVIASTVSGTGQVESDNLISVKPKISGDILKVNVKAGDLVKEGDVLAVIDSSDLKKQVKDAENSLYVAKTNLEVKLLGIADEERAIAQNSVESAKMSYDNSLVDLENTKANVEKNLQKAQLSLDEAQRNYDNTVANQGINSSTVSESQKTVFTNAKNTINSAYLTLRTAVVAADDILGLKNYHETDGSITDGLSAKNTQKLTDAKNNFYTTKTAFDNITKEYESLSANWANEDIEAIIPKMINAFQVAKSTYSDINSVVINSVTSQSLSQSELDSLESKASSQESSILSTINNLQSAKQNIVNSGLSTESSNLSDSNSLANAKASLESAKTTFAQARLDNAKSLLSAENDVKSKKLSYDNAKTQYDQKVAAPRDIDLAILKLNISKAQSDLADAIEDLNNAKVKSPITGKIAKVSQTVGTEATTGTELLSIITEKSLATISLNEVDVSKVQVGQKATVTFSAIEDLTISGEVAEIDNIGTVNQSVVSYEVKISLDTQDDRIKPQMSAAATIKTEEKTDVILIDSTAIKTTTDDLSYVEIPSDEVSASDIGRSLELSKPITVKYVQTGIVGDSATEITDGLAEGDIFILKSSNGSTKTKSTTATSNQRSGMGIMGAIGGGGGPTGGGPGN